MTWLRTVGRWLAGLVIAVPAVLALVLWGQRWRDRAHAAETARDIAWDAVDSTRTRSAEVAQLLRAEQLARESLARKLAAVELAIVDREAAVSEAEPGAGQLNEAWQLEAPDGPSLGEGPVEGLTYATGSQ